MSTPEPPAAVTQPATPVQNLRTFIRKLEELREADFVSPTRYLEFKTKLDILRNFNFESIDAQSKNNALNSLRDLNNIINQNIETYFKPKTFRDYGPKLIITTTATVLGLGGVGAGLYFGGAAIVAAVAAITVAMGAVVGITAGGATVGGVTVGLIHTFKENIKSFFGGVGQVLNRNLIEPWKCLRDSLTGEDRGYVERIAESLGTGSENVYDNLKTQIDALQVRPSTADNLSAFNEAQRKVEQANLALMAAASKLAASKAPAPAPAPAPVEERELVGPPRPSSTVSSSDLGGGVPSATAAPTRPPVVRRLRSRPASPIAAQDMPPNSNQPVVLEDVPSNPSSRTSTPKLIPPSGRGG